MGREVALMRSSLLVIIFWLLLFWYTHHNTMLKNSSTILSAVVWAKQKVQLVQFDAKLYSYSEVLIIIIITKWVELITEDAYTCNFFF